MLYLYGSSVAVLDFRIFNQWGEQVFATTDKGRGWDGIAGGKPQPVGVYMYVARVTLNNGAQRTLKGSINLIR
jgi:gliding motility-associated-like protein